MTDVNFNALLKEGMVLSDIEASRLQEEAAWALERRRTLSRTRNSPNCYWDAQVQGNGTGLDFIVCDGEVLYGTVATDNGYPPDVIPSCPVAAPADMPVDLPPTGFDGTHLTVVLLVGVAFIAVGAWFVGAVRKGRFQ